MLSAFHLFPVSLFVSLYFKSISYRHHRAESCFFIHTDSLCLLIRLFTSHTFNVIIDRLGLGLISCHFILVCLMRQWQSKRISFFPIPIALKVRGAGNWGWLNSDSLLWLTKPLWSGLCSPCQPHLSLHSLCPGPISFLSVLELARLVNLFICCSSCLHHLFLKKNFFF